MEADIADRWADPGTDMNWNADFTQWYEARHPIEETPMENYRKGDTQFQSWEESEKQDAINHSMTMERAAKMVEKAYALARPEKSYSSVKAWAEDVGAWDVALYVEGSSSIFNKYMKGVAYGIEAGDIIDAYLNGTLVGNAGKTRTRTIDTSKGYGYSGTNFYSPQRIRVTADMLDTARLEPTKANQSEVFNARKRILLAAYQTDIEKDLGITRLELNRLIRKWSGCSPEVLEIARGINKGVSVENRWSGIENSTFASRATITADDIRDRVWKITGEATDRETTYIGRTMLAIDTHTNWTWLAFEFLGDEGRVAADNESVLGQYKSGEHKIIVGGNGRNLNTVAHEMGHALDQAWYSDMFGQSRSGFLTMATEDEASYYLRDEDHKAFYEHFMEFVDMLTDVSNNRSEYAMRPQEVFARFIARFVNWTNSISNEQFYTEADNYNDLFTDDHYVEFVRLLQEKAKLDMDEAASTQWQSWEERDAEYMKAVESGDKETMQRMVDEAAKAGGFNVRAYHGTNNGTFTVFDKSKLGKRGSYYDAQSKLGFYFVADKHYATGMSRGANNDNARVYDCYLSIHNPIRTLLTETLYSDGEELKRIEKLKATGDYDGIVDEVGVYVVFNEDQIKSAEPVTYDDEGNVIPLSQRFDTAKDDIRWQTWDEKTLEQRREILSRFDEIDYPKGLYHEAMTWHFDRIFELVTQAYNGYNYTYYFDSEYGLHVIDKFELINIHEYNLHGEFEDAYRRSKKIDRISGRQWSKKGRSVRGEQDGGIRRESEIYVEESSEDAGQRRGDIERERSSGDDKTTVKFSKWDEEIGNKAKEIFGTTENFAEAGYILPDGSMLRFTNDDNPGIRDYAHGAIGIAYGKKIDLEENNGADPDGTYYLERFIDDGAMRLDSGDLEFNLGTGIQISESEPLTREQEQRLREFIRWKIEREEGYKPGARSQYAETLPFVVEFGGNSDYAIGDVKRNDLNAWDVDYLYYEGGEIAADRIINDIRKYYKTGVSSKTESLTAQFHTSWQTWEDGTKKSKGVQLDQQEALTRLKSENFQLEELVKQLTKERDKAVKEAKESGRQLKLTRTNEVRRSDSDKLTNRLIRELGYTGDAEEKQQLRDAMKELGDYIVNATGESMDYDTLKAKARAIARELVSNANMFIDEDRTEEIGVRDRMDALHKELTGRTYRLPAQDRGEIEQAFGSMQNFRKQYFGRFFVSETKGEAIDVLYAQLRSGQLGDNWPDYLPETNSLGEMLLNIAAAVDRTERVYANPFRGNIEESTEAYANDIIFDMLSDEVRQALPTFADVKEAQIGEAKAEGAKKARKAYELGVARLNALRAEKNARIAEVRQQGAAEKKAAVAKEKAEKWKAVAKERNYWRTREAEARAQRNESAAIKRYIKSINKDVKDLIDWSVKPSNKDIRKHVPAEIQGPVRDFVLSIDQSSKRLLGGGAETGNDRAMAKAMDKMRRILDSKTDTGEIYSGRYDLPANFIQEFGKLTAAVNAITANGQGRYVLNNMSAAELKMLRDTLKTLKKLIMDMNVLHNNQMFAHAYEAGENSLSFIEKLGRAKQHVAEFAYKFMGFDNMRPVYVFDRFGEGGQSIFQEFVEGQDELAKLTDEIIAFRDKTYTAEQANEWANEMHEFEVNGEKITMSTAQLMSLYCLNRREQGKTHIFGEGFRVANTTTQKKGKYGIKHSYTYRDEGHSITQQDIGDMLNELTDEQKKVAEKMQEFMSTTCSGWGNYVTRIRFDVDGFTEPYYFPINSDGRILPANADEMPSNASLYALLNAGFTKELKENANNRIILYNIFDVFANHTASMAQYRSFALPVLDALKWFNYVRTEELLDDDTGEETTVKTSLRDEMAKAFGAPEEKTGSGTKGYAESFVINFLKAVNGTSVQGDPYDRADLKVLHGYNRVAIAFNGRVVIQQPMAITRAAMFLKWNELLDGMRRSLTDRWALANEMETYSGMAKWKALGFYDTNVSRGLTDMISYRETFGEKVTELGTKGAELADRLTWGAIWYAAKQSVNRSDYGTEEEYFEAVTKVFENVIIRSQVVDSIVTKSEFLRAKGVGARVAGSFMSEPMTTISMLTDAGFRYEHDIQSGMSGRDAFQKNKGYIKAVFINYVVSQALLAVVQSLYDAWRDDDDYETWLEKYLEALKGNTLDELNPLTKIPYAKDFVEVGKQALADLFGLDMYGNINAGALGNLYNACSKIGKIVSSLREGEGGYTVWALVYRVLQLGSYSGYPLATAYREAKDLWNNTAGKWMGMPIKTYDGGDKNNIKWAYQDGYLTEDEAADELIEKGEAETREEALKLIYGWGTDGDTYANLKQIVESGTPEQFEAAKAEMMSHGFSEDTVNATVRRYIRDLYTDSSKAYGKQDAIEALTAFAGYDSKTANDTVAYWWIMKEYGSEVDADGNGSVKMDELGEFLTKLIRSGEIDSTEAQSIWNGCNPSWKTTYSEWKKK